MPPPVLPPPQLAIPAARATRSSSIPSVVRHLRRCAGTPHSITSAKAAPPADGQISFLVWFKAEVAAAVATVNVAVCAVVPVIVTDGAKLHVAGSLAATGAMAHVRVIAPVNPATGVNVTVEVLPVVAPGAKVIAVPAIVKLGGTVAATSPIATEVLAVLLLSPG